MFPVEFSNGFKLNSWEMKVTLCLWSATRRTLLITRNTRHQFVLDFSRQDNL